jgi:serralysin
MAGFSRRSLLGAAASLAVVRPALAQRAYKIVPYRTFVGPTIQVKAYPGRNIALMLDVDRSADEQLVMNVINAIDLAWDWYRNMFGRAPTPNNTYEGRSTIAENAQDAATYARGRIGNTGIEMGPSTMNRLLIEVAQDRYNQAIFYELGRNFWFFEDQLGALPAKDVGGCFTTGFATVNRFYSMEANGIAGAPWDDALDFDQFRHASLIETVDNYLADPKLNWQNTIGADKPPPSRHTSWIGSYHLAAGFFHRIRRDHGFAGYRRFWQLMAKAPKAVAPRDAVVNFVRVAHAATGQDYRDLLRDRSLPLT